MFSTTTIASSTRMPIEKISAKSVMRLSVYPRSENTKSVRASVTGTASSTTPASRRPRTSAMSSAHRERGNSHVIQKLVRLLRSGLPVVARHRRSDPGGNQARAQALQLALDRANDRDRVGATPLAHRKCDRGILPRCARLPVGHVRRRLFRPVDDAGHVAQADGAAAAFGDRHGAELRGALHETAGLDVELAVARDERADDETPARGFQGVEDRAPGKPSGG